MKINTLNFASFCCIYGVLASVILGAVGAAKAQEAVPLPNQSVLNGLYSPTASERFFEEGKKKIERETKILLNPELYNRENLLKNNLVKTKIIEEIEGINSNFDFPEDSLQQKYNPNMN